MTVLEGPEIDIEANVGGGTKPSLPAQTLDTLTIEDYVLKNDRPGEAITDLYSGRVFTDTLVLCPAVINSGRRITEQVSHVQSKGSNAGKNQVESNTIPTANKFSNGHFNGSTGWTENMTTLPGDANTIVWSSTGFLPHYVTVTAKNTTSGKSPATQCICSVYQTVDLTGVKNIRINVENLKWQSGSIFFIAISSVQTFYFPYPVNGAILIDLAPFSLSGNYLVNIGAMHEQADARECSWRIDQVQTLMAADAKQDFDISQSVKITNT